MYLCYNLHNFNNYNFQNPNQYCLKGRWADKFKTLFFFQNDHTEKHWKYKILQDKNHTSLTEGIWILSSIKVSKIPDQKNKILGLSDNLSLVEYQRIYRPSYRGLMTLSFIFFLLLFKKEIFSPGKMLRFITSPYIRWL